MGVTQKLKPTSGILYKTLDCVVCRKTLQNIDRDSELERLFCSTSCGKMMRCTIEAFAQGFALSWALCSFSRSVKEKLIPRTDSLLKNVSRMQGTNIHNKSCMVEEQSLVRCSSNGTVLGSEHVTQKHLNNDKELVEFDLDDVIPPVYLGNTSHHGNQSLGSGTDSAADTDFVSMAETVKQKIQSVPALQNCEDTGKTGGAGVQNCSSSPLNSDRTVGEDEMVTLKSSSSTTTAVKRKIPNGTEKSLSETELPLAVGKRETKSKKSKLLQTSQSRNSYIARTTRSKKNSSVTSKLHASPESSELEAETLPECLTCDYCSKTFASKRLLKVHIKTHGSDSMVEAEQHSLACEFCAQIFMNRYSLKAHIKRKHSGEEAVECNICGKVQASAFALSTHMKACHDFKSLCHICGASFSGRTSYDKHMASHVGVKRYFCDVCGAGFVHNSSLNNHRAVHLTTKTFQCDVCSQLFKVQHLLNEHLLKVHQCGPSLDHRVRGLKKMGVVVDKDAISRHANHQCVVCGAELLLGSCPSHADSHQEVFQCPTCGDVTSNIVLFYQHVKWHRGTLLSHKRRTSHNGDAPVGLHLSSSGVGVSSSLIKCEVCSKTFKNFEYLSAHMHQHREARFVCNVCSKRFTYKCNLKSHMSTHLDSWQFECETCTKKFRDKYAFKKHQLKHTEPQFKCEICDKALTRRPYLIKHYQKMHPEYQHGIQF